MKYHQVCYQNFTKEYLSGDRLTDNTDAKNNENTIGNVNKDGKLDAVAKQVVVWKRATQDTFLRCQGNKNPPFPYTLFWGYLYFLMAVIQGLMVAPITRSSLNQ